MLEAWFLLQYAAKPDGLARLYHATLFGWPVGHFVADFVELSALLMALLAAWSIEQSFSRSVRYFPTAVHAAGALVLVLESSILLNGVDLSSHDPAGTMARFLAGSLPAYLLAAALAAWFWWIIRAVQKQV